MYTKALLLVVFLLCLSSANVNGQAKLTLSVYYESLCPDSIRFITTRLYSNYLLLGGYGNPYLDIDFVPYGKAETHWNEEANNYTFTCQHGPRECEGNKVQACVLKHLPADRTSEFIYCLMGSTNPAPPEAGPACAEKLQIDFKPVEECLTTDGTALLVALGDRTHNLNPILYYVPWIIFNGEFNEDDLWNSQDDFLAVVCKKLRAIGDGIPPACNL